VVESEAVVVVVVVVVDDAVVEEAARGGEGAMMSSWGTEQGFNGRWREGERTGRTRNTYRDSWGCVRDSVSTVAVAGGRVATEATERRGKAVKL
jgi:hypothetical protein